MSASSKNFKKSVLDKIERYRAELPDLLSIAEYCRVRKRCRSSAFNDLRRKPGLGVKVDGRTYVRRDVMLEHMAKPEPWVPMEDRATRPKTAAAKKSTRARGAKQGAAPRTDAGQEEVQP